MCPQKVYKTANTTVYICNYVYTLVIVYWNETINLMGSHLLFLWFKIRVFTLLVNLCHNAPFFQNIFRKGCGFHVLVFWKGTHNLIGFKAAICYLFRIFNRSGGFDTQRKIPGVPDPSLYPILYVMKFDFHSQGRRHIDKLIGLRIIP